MPTAEIKILCNQIIEEVKLISVGVVDIGRPGRAVTPRSSTA